MTEFYAILGGGGFLGLIATIITVRATRRHDQATEQQGQFKNDIELNKYIREIVEKAVEDATWPLRDQITQLREQLKSYLAKDRIVSRFVQRLYWWDDAGRTGTMPRLTFDEQKALDLDLFPEDTRPPRNI